jgi:hypothetical protein
MSNVNDFHMTDDIDADWSQVSSEQLALLEALYRRLVERARGLFYELTYGLGVRDFLSASLAQDRIIARVTTECRKEDDVSDVFVTLDSTGTLDVRVDSVFGEFSFTLAQQEQGTNGT